MSVVRSVRSVRSVALVACCFAGEACEDPFFALYDGGAPASDAGLSDGSSRCIDLEVKAYSVPDHGGSSALVAFGADRVLFAQQNSSPTWYSGGLDGVRPEPSISTLGFTPESAVLRGDEIWLGGQDGTVVRGRPVRGEPFVRASTVSAGESLRWIAASPPDMPLEIFALGDPGQKGRLYRFDGTHFAVLYDKPSGVPQADPGNGGVAWVAPGEAYFVPNAERCGTGPVCVVHVIGAKLVEEEPPTGYGITTVADIAGFGVLTGDANGFLLVKRPEGWRTLEHAILGAGNHIRAIRAYHGGFIAMSDRQAAQYYGDTGLCLNVADLRTLTSGIIPDVTQMQPFTGGVAAVGDAYGDMTGTLIVFKEL